MRFEDRRLEETQTTHTHTHTHTHICHQSSAVKDSVDIQQRTPQPYLCQMRRHRCSVLPWDCSGLLKKAFLTNHSESDKTHALDTAFEALKINSRIALGTCASDSRFRNSVLGGAKISGMVDFRRFNLHSKTWFITGIQKRINGDVNMINSGTIELNLVCCR